MNLGEQRAVPLQQAGRAAGSGCAAGLLVLPLALLLTAPRWLRRLGHWLAVSSQSGSADAIAVLSGGGPERLVHGIALYRQGIAPELWYTGDAPIATMTSFTDGHFARDFAIAQGVPEEVIHLLATTSTWEDGQAIVARARREGARRIMLVTSWYHSRRALCVVRRLAADEITVYCEAPPPVGYGPDDWWRHEDGLVFVVNELLKFGHYWWQYGLRPWKC